ADSRRGRPPRPARRSRRGSVRRHAAAPRRRTRSRRDSEARARVLEPVHGDLDSGDGGSGEMTQPRPSSPADASAGGRDLKHLRPYGDKWNDGIVQVSFTLPLRLTPVATEAAKRYAAK